MNNKTIHIIWLGPKPLYDKYLSSVRKYCPKGFNIKIWRDDEIVPLCQDCSYFSVNYKKSNWAFCSDYARFKILYTYGGIYIDTDVEFIAPIDDLIEKGSFFANEKLTGRVTSGLIMYMDHPNDEIIGVVKNYYETDGHKWTYLADGEILSEALKKHGYVPGEEQTLDSGITIYKGGTFDGDKNSPESWARAIHWYTHLWVDVRLLQDPSSYQNIKPVIK